MITLKKVLPNEYSCFADMFARYQEDLMPYSEQLGKLKNRKKRIVLDYVQNDDLQKMWIIENGDMLGFIVLQYVDIPDIVSPAWYIVEFFVSPECRSQGVGERAFKTFLDNFQGDFFYYILKENVNAKNFWAKMTYVNGLKEVERIDIFVDDEVEVHCFAR